MALYSLCGKRPFYNTLRQLITNKIDLKDLHQIDPEISSG